MKEKLVELFSKAPRFEITGGLCDVAIVCGKEFTWHPQQGCHGILAYPPVGVSAVYTSLRCRFERDWSAAKKYWDFILDPKESPYRAVLKKVEVLYDKDKEPIAVGLLDLDVPAQISIALFMQTRVPYEHWGRVAAFGAFLDRGFSKIQAFYLSELFWVEGNSLRQVTNTHAAHTPRVDFAALKNAAPVGIYNQNTWARRSHYGPVQQPWLGGNANRVYDLVNDKGEYSGSFKSLYLKVNGGTHRLGKTFFSIDRSSEILHNNSAIWSN